MWHSWTKSINATPGENLHIVMTTVSAFKFSDYEYFTNKCMSLFNYINQIIFVLETKKISVCFSCLCIVIPSRHKTSDQEHLCNVKWIIHTKVQQKCWMHPLKIMILFAWSWSTNFIYSKVNNKIFVQPCWFLLYTLEMPVTESPTVVAVQHYTQLDDPEFNFYFHHNNVDQAVQLCLI